MSKKIAIIGIDGANKTILNQMNVKQFSHCYDFISTIPPYTPPSWVSIITGVNPGKHNIYGFKKFNRETKEVLLNSASDMKYRSIFEILDKLNLNSIYINLPMTYPFSEIENKKHAIIISDWASPKQEIFPEELHDQYKKYMIDPPHEWMESDNLDIYFEKIEEYLTKRMNIYKDLLTNKDWNVFFIVFSEIDWILHRLPSLLHEKPSHQVKSIYNKINEFIQLVVMQSDIIFIVSDHGFERKKSTFHVNEFLKRKNIIQTSDSKMKIVKKIQTIMPHQVEAFLKNHMKNQSLMKYKIKPSKNSAIMIEPANWGIYTDNNSEKIIRELQETSGIHKIVRSTDIYKGNYVHNGPDILIIPKKGVKFSYKFHDKLFEDTAIGDHEIHGVFAVTGKDIKKDITFEKLPHVFDIVPTILHIFNLKIPKDTDGRVLKEIFTENSMLKQKPVSYDESYEEDKLKQNIAKLKKVGKI